MKRFLLGFVTAVIIGGGYLYSSGLLAPPWAGTQKGPAPAPAHQADAPSPQAGPPVEVAVYTVKPQKVVFTKDLAGRTSAYQVAEIRPQVTGIILKRMFTQGGIVKKGSSFIRLIPPLTRLHMNPRQQVWCVPRRMSKLWRPSLPDIAAW